MKIFIVLLSLVFCTAGLSAQDKSVTFSPQYIQQHEGSIRTEVPEVQELAYIMMAISERGLKDSNMVNHRTPYYREVQEAFGPFREHRMIQVVDSLLGQSLIYYIFLSSNAYGFTFEGDSLKETNVYTFPAKGVGATEIKVDPIQQYKGEIEDFAKVSGFRKFYQDHAAYYQSLAADYAKYAQIAKQKQWLESKFDYRINSYRVLTSGLVGGINATSTFEDNAFKEILLYLPTIKNNPAWSEEQNTALNSRVIFTEIDHNYVGPLSARYKQKIEGIFDKRTFWVDATNKTTNHYPTPIKVFDEYLTWGLFLLYIHDMFPNNTALLKEMFVHVNTKMQAKGFPQSEAFNETLFSLYKRKPAAKIEALYEGLLDWAARAK